ncbi:MAG: 1-(5-phosphoribosyl)-5-[Clostridia bacterium]|nr:1-(5-phosphoribosyl)-5-[(5-phosphoribosylamino)methylideneamino]imidazole-4-carboxamide isomerase [Clostridia bacterium]
MEIYPAIDLYDGKVVRLYKGKYNEMTVYADDPLSVVREFEACGAKYLHLVDLEGARSGTTANDSVIRRIAENTPLFIELGGGIRNEETIAAYLSCGISRVILGTAAVQDPELLKKAVRNYGSAIAVGADIRDGRIAIKGWEEESRFTAEDFFSYLDGIGVETVICTDISRDGAMQGTNRELYRHLAQQVPIRIIASGGVSSLEDIRALRDSGIAGAIIGKAYYKGAIDLKEAIKEAT